MRLRIPLGPLPAGYEPYILTSCESDKPISDYVPLPLPTVSSMLPRHLFRNFKIAPKSYAGWITQKAPLIYWHVTHFKHPGNEYSCIGITVSHGLLDATGLASIVHALEAEMLGKEWVIPPPLHPGLNVNHLQTVLEKAAEEEANKVTEADAKYEMISIFGLGTLLKMLVGIIWQWVWHKAERKLIILPPKVYEKVVHDARAAMDKESGGQSKVRLSTGDVLTAWIFKVYFFYGFAERTYLHFPSSYIQTTHRNLPGCSCRIRHLSAGSVHKI